MSGGEKGLFSRRESGLRDGQRYHYSLDGGPCRPDPCSLWQPEGVNGPSAVVDTTRFQWSDDSWRGVKRSDLIFYELHVGTFTPRGTFAEIVPRLPALRELGVTAIQLMPVAQFPGSRNWGYDGVLPYSTQDSYGGPWELQRLVDACHSAGLAIFLDVVYNHLGPEGNYLNDFGPYFTDKYRTPWGLAINFDGLGSDEVREYFTGNARMWLREFHFDGLRLDAVHSIFDFSARHILRALQETADEVAEEQHREIHLVAESDLNDPRLLTGPAQGGYGLALQWSDDFHHALHAYLTGERQGYYQDFGTPEQIAHVMRQPFLFVGQYSAFRGRRHGAACDGFPGDRFVVCLQNHDQVGNRAKGDRLTSLLAEPAQRRLAASLLLFNPYVPLLFMGQEYDEDAPFPFFCSFSDESLLAAVRAGRKQEFETLQSAANIPDPGAEQTFESARLTWSWPEGSGRAGIRRLYQDLLRARRNWPAAADFVNRRARLVPDSRTGPVLELSRGEGADCLCMLFNLSGVSQMIPAFVAPVLWSSENETYGGTRHSQCSLDTLLPFECLVFRAGSSV
jgi:maltooligosyltrehalose trehalohydrolase